MHVLQVLPPVLWGRARLGAALHQAAVHRQALGSLRALSSAVAAWPQGSGALRCARLRLEEGVMQLAQVQVQQVPAVQRSAACCTGEL